jgi:hypothetical protein
MTIAQHIVALLLALGAANAQSQSPYAGQHERPIKALSEDEIRQYLAGAGMGYAKAAELNGFPGPMHVLELADDLRLSAGQREATQRLMESHKADARAIGAKRIAAEKRLDSIFLSGKIDAQSLAEAVRAAAAVEGDYRLSHLETHRRMRLLLSDEQVARYNEARGYSSPAGHSPHKH